MRQMVGIVMGVGFGYFVAIGIAFFVHAEHVRLASLLLALTCCGLGGLLGFGITCGRPSRRPR